MSDSSLYPVAEHLKATAAIDHARYLAMYQQSINDPEQFWSEQAQQFLVWQQPWSQLNKSDMHKGEVAWFIDGKLNVSVNCIDRHLPARANQVAIIWEGDNPNEEHYISYQALHDEVCRLANALRASGVNKGDRVCIYMPMVPEAAYAMLACARIGALHLKPMSILHWPIALTYTPVLSFGARRVPFIGIKTAMFGITILSPNKKPNANLK